MNCLVCQKLLDQWTPFCADHAPECNSNLYNCKTAIFVGNLLISDVILAKLVFHYKIIRWWVGTDVWLLYAWPPGRGKLSILWHRIKYWLLDRFVDENWLTSIHLKDEFEEFCNGKKAVVRWHIQGMLTEKLPKKPDSKISIAYYHPKENTIFQREVYGIDLIERLMPLYPEVNWIRLDGTKNMREIFPILTAYLRPTRHDGRSRLLAECQIQDIPYYWSGHGQPSIAEMKRFVDNIILKTHGNI